MTTREKKFSYLVAMSDTQKVLNTAEATELLKKKYPEGRIKQTIFDGFNVVLCEFYYPQTDMFLGVRYIVTDEQ